MANYRKSFNLRNGVQVDDDNFIVNANGLVGIGTSVPTEFLDVRGNAKVVGLVTSNSSFAANATVGFLTATQGASVNGVVTATSFSGSASGLTGIYAIAVDGWYISGGNISTTSNVGVGTTNPQGTFQVGSGVIINSDGGATYTGVVTASSFSGSLNASNLTGTIDNTLLSSNINVSGVITASSGFVGNLTGNVVGIASTALSLSGTPNISVGVVTASSLSVGPISGTNISANNIQSGIVTATTRLYAESVGIGTSVPSSNLHVRRSGQASIQVTSDSNSSLIGLGRSESITGYNGVLRYGNTSALFPYSTPDSLDILNYGSGNVNFYLEASNVSTGTTGSFYWHRRPNLTRLMTLTYDGNLGLGVTLPTRTLEVVGTSTVTSDAYFGSNVSLTNNLTVGNNLTVTNDATINGSLSLSGNLGSNVEVFSGISTFYNINVTNQSEVQSLGIGISNTDPDYSLIINGGATNSVVVTTGGKLGIKTTFITGSLDLDATKASGAFQSVGVGTTTLRSAADFADAGKNYSSAQFAYMIVPRLTNSQRAGLSTVAGAFIFNTDTSKFQGYTGVAWTDFH